MNKFQLTCCQVFSFFLLTINPIFSQTCTINGLSDLCLNEEGLFSVSPDFQRLSFAWDVGANGTVSALDDGLSANIRFNTPGLHTIIYSAEYLAGTHSCTFDVMVENELNPVFELPQEVCLDDILTLEIDLDPNTYQSLQWNVFGDVDFNQIGDELTITATNPGTFSVGVNITSLNGCVFSSMVKVSNVITPPLSDFEVQGSNSSSFSFCRGEQVFFNPIAIASGQIVEYEWRIMDVDNQVISSGGSPNPSPTPTHQFTFNVPGDYQVSLKITTSKIISLGGDDSGSSKIILCTSESFKSITINNDTKIPIDCITTLCEGDQVEYSTEASCSSFQWEVLSGGSIIGSNNENTVSVLWNNIEGPFGILKITGIGCSETYCDLGSTYYIPIIPNTLEIKGAALVCQNARETYSVPLWLESSYHWTLTDIDNPSSTNIPQINPIRNPLPIFFGGFKGSFQLNLELENDVFGCRAVASKNINVVNYNITSDVACNGEDALFSIDPPISGMFSIKLITADQTIALNNVAPNSFTVPGIYLASSGSAQIVIEVMEMNTLCNFQYDFQIPEVIMPANSIKGPLIVCPGQIESYEVDDFDLMNTEYEWYVDDILQTNITGNTLHRDFMGAGSIHKIEVIHIINGCRSNPYSIDVLVDDQAMAIIEGNENVCTGSKETYFVQNVSDSYQWSIAPPQAGSILTSPYEPSIDIQWNIVNSNVTLILEYDACGVPVTVLKPIMMSGLELDLPSGDICVGEDALFTIPGISGGLVTWSINNEEVEPNGDETFLMNFTAGGFYTIRADVKEGSICPKTVVLIRDFEVIGLPVPVITQDDVPPCDDGSSFNFNLITADFEGLNYALQWQKVGMAIDPTQTQNIYNINSIGTYFVEISDGTCVQKSDNLFVTQPSCISCDCQNAPSVGIDDIPDNCGNIFNVLGSFSEPSNFVSGTYQVQKGDQILPGSTFTFTDINDLNHDIDLSDADIGTYLIQLTVTYQCSSDNTIECAVRAQNPVEVILKPQFEYQFICDETTGEYLIKFENQSAFHPNHPASAEWIIDGNLEGVGDIYEHFGVLGNTVLNVELRLHTSSGSTCNLVQQVTTPEPVTADFIVRNTEACQGQLIDFSAEMNESEVLNYLWNFGDNSFSDLKNATKVYSVSGTYTVILTIETIYGCTITSSKMIIVNDNEIMGQIEMEEMPCGAIQLSFNPDDGTTIIDYNWNGPGIPSPANSDVILAQQSGLYTLVVTNSNGCTRAFNEEIFIQDQEVSIIENRVNCERIFLCPSSSQMYTYKWTVTNTTNNCEIIFDNANCRTIQISDCGPGNYVVLLEAFGDGQNLCATASTSFELFDFPSGIFIAVSEEICEPVSKTLTANFAPISNYRLEWYHENILIASDINPLTIYEGGFYRARVVDLNNNCFNDSPNQFVRDPINFDDFLSGCLDLCIENYINDGFELNHFPFDIFDSWEWTVTFDNQPLFSESGTGTIRRINILPTTVGEYCATLTLVKNGCTFISDELCLNFENCCDVENQLEVVCIGAENNGFTHQIMGHLEVLNSEYEFCFDDPLSFTFPDGNFIHIADYTLSLDGRLFIINEGYAYVQNPSVESSISQQLEFDLCKTGTSFSCPTSILIEYPSCENQPCNVKWNTFFEERIDVQQNITVWHFDFSINVGNPFNSSEECEVEEYIVTIYKSNGVVFKGPVLYTEPSDVQGNIDIDFNLTTDEVNTIGCLLIDVENNCDNYCETEICFDDCIFPENFEGMIQNNNNHIENRSKMSIHETDKFSLKIYPNPVTKKKFFIEIQNLNEKLFVQQLFIRNLNGQVIFTKELTPNQFTIEIENKYSSGVYLIDFLLSDGTMRSEKLVVID